MKRILFVGLILLMSISFMFAEDTRSATVNLKINADTLIVNAGFTTESGLESFDENQTTNPVNATSIDMTVPSGTNSNQEASYAGVSFGVWYRVRTSKPVTIKLYQSEKMNGAGSETTSIGWESKIIPADQSEKVGISKDENDPTIVAKITTTDSAVITKAGYKAISDIATTDLGSLTRIDTGSYKGTYTMLIVIDETTT